MTHPSKPSTLRFALRRGLLVLALSCTTLSVQAQTKSNGLEDIDIFVNTPATGDLPNVLLVLDTSANWGASAANACATYADGTPGPDPSKEQGKKIAIQKCALVNTLLALPTNADGSAKFRVGIMYMNAPNANGAYPRHRFLELTTTNKALLADVLKGTKIDGAGDQGSNADYARSLWEAYLWYGGQAPLYGRAQTNVSRKAYDDLAFNPTATGNYAAPALASCAANYVIIIANGSPQGNEADVKPLIAAAGGNDAKISYPSAYVSTSDQNNWADETARFVQQVGVSGPSGPEKITVYSVAITVASPTPSEQRSNNFIKEIAIQGGGNGYSATNVDELTAALRDIFNRIQAVNTVFASASLPVSVNAQGTFLNQVFMGMFRPDSQGLPRWVGNLKQYKFGYNPATQKVDLVDAAGEPAVNAGTGFIAPGALSLWTSGSTYWANASWPGEVNVGGASDSPDGQIVEKGGAAQRLRVRFATSQAARKVYTASGSSLVDFAKTNTALLTPAAMGVSTAAERDLLVDWARGADNNSPSDEKGPGGTVTVRPSVHGDVIHSSPAIVNYGGTTGVVAFYGTNGGMLHAVRGSATAADGGDELWSFAPPEFLSKFKRLRDNQIKVQFGTTDMTQVPTPQRKDYGMDGPITFFQNTATGKVYLFAAMRRGGRALYAFDVSNPATPSLMWRVDNSSAGLGALGQTWSEARVTRIAGIDDPVLIMGGGYDPAEDLFASPAPTMGHSVLVLNARTGALLKAFTGLSRPVPAAVALVDLNGDRRTERAYAVDLGGSVYRLLLPGADVSAWSLTKIADFSGSSSAGQKMFYAPAVTPTVMGGKTVYAVMVGTGDREKPLQTSGTENRFFTVLDRGQSVAKVIGDLVQMPLTGLASIPDDKYGCYLNLPNTGEKVVNAVTYTTGFSFFATNGPASKTALACKGDLGVARSYAIPALCGPVQVTDLVGGGFPPTAVVGTVLIPPPRTGVPVDCETTPHLCRRVPVGIGVSPPDCAGGASTLTSSIGATNVYACAPALRQRRDWSIPAPR